MLSRHYAVVVHEYAVTEQYAEISPCPVLFIHAEKAYSLYISKTAYENAAEPKEMMIIPDASHVDL